MYETSSADTIAPCATWFDCRDLDPAEANEVLAVVTSLIDNPYWECRETGYRLNELLMANRIKVGLGSSGDRLGSIHYTHGLPPLIHNVFLKSTLFGALWENRFVVVHEGYHARGNLSSSPWMSIRRFENESLYDPAANDHANLCS
jgi:hypothetical protein